LNGSTRPTSSTLRKPGRGGLVRSVHDPTELLPAAYALAHRFTDTAPPPQLP
jgi:hypothetical protein